MAQRHHEPGVLAYYIVYANEADESYEKYRAFCTVEMMRTTWEKTTNPYVRFITWFHRPSLPIARPLLIPRPQVGAHHTRPSKAWLYYAKSERQLRMEEELVLDFCGGGYICRTRNITRSAAAARKADAEARARRRLLQGTRIPVPVRTRGVLRSLPYAERNSRQGDWHVRARPNFRIILTAIVQAATWRLAWRSRSSSTRNHAFSWHTLLSHLAAAPRPPNSLLRCPNRSHGAQLPQSQLWLLELDEAGTSAPPAPTERGQPRQPGAAPVHHRCLHLFVLRCARRDADHCQLGRSRQRLRPQACRSDARSKQGTIQGSTLVSVADTYRRASLGRACSLRRSRPHLGRERFLDAP